MNSFDLGLIMAVVVIIMLGALTIFVSVPFGLSMAAVTGGSIKANDWYIRSKMKKNNN